VSTTVGQATTQANHNCEDEARSLIPSSTFHRTQRERGIEARPQARRGERCRVRAEHEDERAEDKP
jgi:hypothetical protein